MNSIKMYGTTWCGDCIRAKKFLDRNKIKYEYTDVDEEPQYQEYIKKLNHGEQRVPTIIFSDGSFLVEPTDEELNNKIESLT
jgi:glutaredoxin-like protein